MGEINDEEFWGHNLDDHGTKDLPLMLNFVLEETKQEKLVYIGHSMGATALFMMCDVKPEFNSKIKDAYLLAPVADLTNITGLPQNLVKSAKLVMKILEMVNIYTLFFPRLIPGWSILGILIFQICGYNSVTSDIDCDINKVKNILKFSPSGSTTKSILQYLKCHDEKNLVSSGTENGNESYVYSLDKTTIPITILYAEKDVFAGTENIRRMKDDLPNLVGLYKMPEDYGHLDFIWEGGPADAVLDELIIKEETPVLNEMPAAAELSDDQASGPTKSTFTGIIGDGLKKGI